MFYYTAQFFTLTYLADAYGLKWAYIAPSKQI